MSRVHDALRRAEQSARETAPTNPTPPQQPLSPTAETHPVTSAASTGLLDVNPITHSLLDLVQEVPYRTATDSLLIDATRPHEAPMEEFRTLRTRLNHMK